MDTATTKAEVLRTYRHVWLSAMETKNDQAHLKSIIEKDFDIAERFE